MLYTVTGADRSTGQDVTQTFDAKSPAEAESIASLTMLVSKVIAEPSDRQLPSVAYATPHTPAPRRPIDWAAGLERQARFLRILSWIIAVSAILPAFQIFRDLSIEMWYSGLFATIGSFTSHLMDGHFTDMFLMLTAAVIMRIIAHAALVLRELAVRRQSQSD